MSFRFVFVRCRRRLLLHHRRLLLHHRRLHRCRRLHLIAFTLKAFGAIIIVIDEKVGKVIFAKDQN